MVTVTTTKIELTDCREESVGDHGGTCWTHESGAYVELIHDDDPINPLDDMEGVAISFREGDHYNGTTDDHPRDPSITCPSCEGSGVLDAEGPETEWNARYASKGGGIDVDCARCDGAGEVDCDLPTWFKHEHGAVAIHEFSTGSYSEAHAVMVITTDDFTDPQGTAKGYADEYESWATGDVWGIQTGGPGVETESVWGFIGREYAETAARDEFLQSAVDDVTRERDEAAYWLEREIETVDA